MTTHPAPAADPADRPAGFPPLPAGSRMTVCRAESGPTPTLEVVFHPSTGGRWLLAAMALCWPISVAVAWSESADTADVTGLPLWVMATLGTGTAFVAGAVGTSAALQMLMHGRVFLTSETAEVDRSLWWRSWCFAADLTPGDGVRRPGRPGDGWSLDPFRWGSLPLLNARGRLVPLGPMLFPSEGAWMRAAALAVIGEEAPRSPGERPPTIPA